MVSVHFLLILFYYLTQFVCLNLHPEKVHTMWLVGMSQFSGCLGTSPCHLFVEESGVLCPLVPHSLPFADFISAASFTLLSYKLVIRSRALIIFRFERFLGVGVKSCFIGGGEQCIWKLIMSGSFYFLILATDNYHPDLFSH